MLLSSLITRMMPVWPKPMVQIQGDPVRTPNLRTAKSVRHILKGTHPSYYKSHFDKDALGVRTQADVQITGDAPDHWWQGYQTELTNLVAGEHRSEGIPVLDDSFAYDVSPGVPGGLSVRNVETEGSLFGMVSKSFLLDIYRQAYASPDRIFSTYLAFDPRVDALTEKETFGADGFLSSAVSFAVQYDSKTETLDLAIRLFPVADNFLADYLEYVVSKSLNDAHEARINGSFLRSKTSDLDADVLEMAAEEDDEDFYEEE